MSRRADDHRAEDYAQRIAEQAAARLFFTRMLRWWRWI
jgi:hypothetical protein